MIETAKTRLGERSPIIDAFEEAVAKIDSDGSLVEAVLGIALLEYPKLHKQKYLNWFENRADEIFGTLSPGASVREKIDAINDKLFNDYCFNGNLQQYYDPRNSFLNEVIDRRLGIPITLAIVYMELARRIGLSLRGIGLPGHFIVGCINEGEQAAANFYIDPFHNGRILDSADCAQIVETLYDGRVPFQMDYLRPSSPTEILIRIINNLKSIYANAKLNDKLLILHGMLMVLDTEDPRTRYDRAILRIEEGDAFGALKDLESYTDTIPESLQSEEIKNLIRTCKINLASLN
ncbi:MAG TPA: transglutaminase-like domain-containing protein [Blastocatellia bacterium]|nr:transglutaminase-like domain-containing protein [Blastocatellia bacterium]